MFHYVLANLIANNRDALGAIFLDGSGETVDLACADFSPYEMKVVGAYLGIYIRRFEKLLSGNGLGELRVLHIEKRGIHIYVPIQRGPTQKDVWTFAKRFADGLALLQPALVTAEYRISHRPQGRVLVDYNQNAWGRTLASIYSVRPHPQAAVSTPVTWAEIEKGIAIEQFTLRNVPDRLRKVGDLWAPLLAAKGRFKLEKYL